MLKAIYTFPGVALGGPVVMDGSGALYGVMFAGGPGAYGDVYRLTPPAKGTVWTETTLYSFTPSPHYPRGPLAIGPTGAIFGTAQAGGHANKGSCNPGGCGGVFELLPPKIAGGSWTYRNIHLFSGGTDGGNPLSGVVLSASGIVYGTTNTGGTFGKGTVFQLTPPATPTGIWSETVIHTFGGTGDGSYPSTRPTIMPSGALVGTTGAGGAAGAGTVFELAPPATPSGSWVENTLYSFSGPADGNESEASLLLSSTGALFGTTLRGGGAANDGTVFKLTPPAGGSGSWTESVLYRFNGGAAGSFPGEILATDATGALYGSTFWGSTHNFGAAFKLIPPTAGATRWTASVLHVFAGGADSTNPSWGLTSDGAGGFYGISNGTGVAYPAVVYRITQ